MHRLVAAAVLVVVAIVSTPARAEENAMSCGAYLAESKGSRDPITGMFLWLKLKEDVDRVTRNQAGTLIALVPTMRKMIDTQCVGGGDLVPVVASVIYPFFNAAMSDPKIR